jgi:hypothetical protein
MPTPGPWRAEPEKLLHDDRHVAGRCPRVYRHEQRIADVLRTLNARIKDGRDPEAEANARLIAAAPTMLKALQDVAMLIDGQEDVVDGNDGPRPNQAMSIAQIIEPALAAAGFPA